MRQSPKHSMDKMQPDNMPLVDFTYSYLSRLRRRFQPLLPHHFDIEHYYTRLNATCRSYIYYMTDMSDPEEVLRVALTTSFGHPDTIKQESSSEESSDDESTHTPPTSSSPIRNPYSGEPVRSNSPPAKWRGAAR